MPNKQKPIVLLQDITFNDGTVIKLGEEDIIVIVGPNNAGKSATLRELNLKAISSRNRTDIVEGVNLNKIAKDEEALLNWFRNEGTVHKNPQKKIMVGNIAGVYEKDYLKSLWERDNLDGIGGLFIRHVSSEERLNAASPAPNISIDENPQHPLQIIERKVELEEKLSGFFFKAYGVDLVLNRAGGSQLPLHVGKRPEIEGDEDRLSTSYREKILDLPQLQVQGDGMRGFAGILLSAIASGFGILLIDEPEAFLHPPQARLLGQILAQETSDKQLIVATHDADFLRGIISGDYGNVRVCRIKREGNINHINLLNNKDIKELWSDPILRYSNILEGIFHEQVVICEGDADCHFYQAVLESLADADETKRVPDTLFTHAGGKQRIPTLMNALSKTGVPVKVIADFDVLNNVQPLSKMVQAQGGNHKEIETLRSRVASSINEKTAELRTANVKEEIENILNEIDTPNVPESAVRSVNEIMRRTSPWSEAKRQGKSFVPSGQASENLKKLLNILKDIGIFVVPSGELESFAKTIPGHGPRWLNGVLEKNLLEDEDLREAREFVLEVFPELKE